MPSALVQTEAPASASATDAYLHLLPFHGKPYPLSRQASEVIQIEPAPLFKIPSLNLGRFAALPLACRYNIYSHLILHSTNVSILAPSELICPNLALTSKAFHHDLKSWYQIARNSNLANFSDEQLQRKCHQYSPLCKYVLDFTKYFPRTHISLRMNRFNRLYDVALVRMVHIKPVMLRERKAGLEMNRVQFADIMRILYTLDKVSAVEFYLTSTHRDPVVSRATYMNWMASKGTERCPLKMQKSCKWPVEMTWCLFASALAEILCVKVSVFMDGEGVDVRELCCEYVRESYVMRSLMISLRCLGRELRMKTRGRDMCDVM